jgi:hypothetical protein
VNTNDLDGAERLSNDALSSALLLAQPLVTPPRRPTPMATQDSPITVLTRAATYPRSHAQEDLGPPLCRLAAQANTTLVERSEEQHREH